MNKLVIYGSGGFGREVACLINRINEESPTWDMLGFIDDTKPVGEDVFHFGKILGGYQELNEWKDNLAVVVAIGEPHAFNVLHNRIINQKVYFPNIIHPDFGQADVLSTRMGVGNIITRGCNFSCNVTVGNFNIFNSSISLGHDVSMGSYNSLMGGVKISGCVQIGDENFFGVAAIVLQGIKIGNRVRIGAGSVLITKPKDDSTYLGNPAKKIFF